MGYRHLPFLLLPFISGCFGSHLSSRDVFSKNGITAFESRFFDLGFEKLGEVNSQKKGYIGREGSTEFRYFINSQSSPSNMKTQFEKVFDRTVSLYQKMWRKRRVDCMPNFFPKQFEENGDSFHIRGFTAETDLQKNFGICQQELLDVTAGILFLYCKKTQALHRIDLFSPNKKDVQDFISRIKEKPC